VKIRHEINDVLAAGMTSWVIVFFGFVVDFCWVCTNMGRGSFAAVYDPATFNLNSIFHGTSIAVLT